MQFLKTFLAVVVLVSMPALSAADADLFFPEQIGAAGETFALGQPARTYDRGSLKERFRDEVERLKSYGAKVLFYAHYRTGRNSAEEISIDIVDLGTPLNAYGLYRLYAGCEKGLAEVWISGGRVLPGDTLSYARFGQYLLRVEVHGASNNRQVMEEALKGVFAKLCAAALPDLVDVLEEAARSACDVDYHPLDIDSELQAGPGYRWVAPGGEVYFLRTYGTKRVAETFAGALEKRLDGKLLLAGQVVIWTREKSCLALSL
jgi:hypothetical protein